MPRPSRPRRAVPALPVALAALAVLGTGVSTAASGLRATSSSPPVAAAVPTAAGTPGAGPAPSAVPQARVAGTLPPLTARQRADVSVTAADALTPESLASLVALTPGAVAVRSAPVTSGDAPLPAVAVDPSTFRAFAAEGTAEADAVWQAVARGEAVVSHEAAQRLQLVLGGTVPVVPRGGGAPVLLRVGALATTGLPRTDLVVDDAVGGALGLPGPNEVLLGAGDGDPLALASAARAVAGPADVDLLTEPAAPTAFLTGGKAAKAFGAFSYRYFPDGTIEPDAAWVRQNIATADVPVMGRVTCHRLMLPQLRGALAEVQARGLAGSLHTFDGCYVPRFIERNPARSVSLHTWGIAIDLDASTNGRGIRGTMDPQVVEVFKRWGFRWGGDWAWSDPMHFELGAVLDGPPPR